MAKAPLPVGYTKVTVKGTYGPTNWVNVLYLDTSPTDPANYADLLPAACTAITDLYDAIVHTSNFSDQLTVSTVKAVYADASESVRTLTVADGTVGTHSGDCQDAQVAYLINWASDDGRRGGKPRSYLPGVPNAAMLDPARLQSSTLSSINGLLSTWYATFPRTGDTYTIVGLVEMSFVEHNADRNPAIAISINGGTLNGIVATQRRRVDRLRA
jgi:hypothetical protein